MGDSIHLVVLTHDVDWGARGPPLTHILERSGRFDPEAVEAAIERRVNLYDGIPDILEAEERVYAKSTILFRPWYDDGSTVDDYAYEIMGVEREGWEIGLHSNPDASIEGVARQRLMVEDACGCRVVSHRAHYLWMDEHLVARLSEAGILVDSSLCLSKASPRAAVESPDYRIVDGVLELYLTVMDAYVFSYWGLGEEEVLRVVPWVVRERAERGLRVTTLLWHANVTRMRGGRVYARLLEELYSIDSVVFARMIDAYRILVGEGRLG